MTQHSTPPDPPAGVPQAAPTAPSTARQKNTVGLVAIIASFLGFIFACIPGAFIVGWILLLVGFILGIIAVTRNGQKKGTGIAAIVLSVVGTIVGVIVFLVVATGAVSDAVDESAGGDTTVVTEDDDAEGGGEDSGEQDSGASAAPAEEDVPAAGTRDNPLTFSDAVQNDNWTVALTGFNADADAEVAEANQFNDTASEGTQWVTVDVSATYDGADTGDVFELSFDYVTADGNVIGTYDSSASGLEPEFDSFAELYEGGTEEGRIAFLVPDSVDGLLRVTPGMFADEVFFALPSP